MPRCVVVAFGGLQRRSGCRFLIGHVLLTSLRADKYLKWRRIVRLDHRVERNRLNFSALHHAETCVGFEPPPVLPFGSGARMLSPHARAGLPARTAEKGTDQK